MLFTENRKARHEYQFLKTIEAGLVLEGHEVKAISEGGAKLDGSYLKILGGELKLVGSHIRPYSKAAHRETIDPNRTITVLVSKKELRELAEKSAEKGLTMVPISFYPVGRRIKLSFAIAKGKQAHDKRDALKQRDIERTVRRVMRGEDE